MRIVFFVNSLTAGFYGGNFVRAVAQALPAHEIINAGVGGDTVINLEQRVDAMLAEHSPDAVFVMIGGNDAVSYSMPAARPYYKSAKDVPDGIVTPEHFERSYRAVLTHIQLAHAQALVGLAPSEYNADLIAAVKRFNAIARDLADGLRVPVLDLASRYIPQKPVERPPVDIRFIQQIGVNVSQGWQDYESERARWGYTYSFDGMHLLPETATEFGQHITDFLREHLSL